MYVCVCVNNICTHRAMKALILPVVMVVFPAALFAVSTHDTRVDSGNLSGSSGSLPPF